MTHRSRRRQAPRQHLPTAAMDSAKSSVAADEDEADLKAKAGEDIGVGEDRAASSVDAVVDVVVEESSAAALVEVLAADGVVSSSKCS